MQRDSCTYCDEPEDVEDFDAWSRSFSLEARAEDIAEILRVNAFMSELHSRIVPLARTSLPCQASMTRFSQTCNLWRSGKSTVEWSFSAAAPGCGERRLLGPVLLPPRPARVAARGARSTGRCPCGTLLFCHFVRLLCLSLTWKKGDFT